MYGVEYFRLKEVSKRLSVSTKFLRDEIKRGRLRATKIGGNYYVFKNEYDKYIFTLQADGVGIDPELLKDILKQEQRIQNTDLARMIKEMYETSTNSRSEEKVEENVPK